MIIANVAAVPIIPTISAIVITNIFFFFHIFIKFFVIIEIFAMGTKINDIISNHIVFIDLKLIF